MAGKGGRIQSSLWGDSMSGFGEVRKVSITDDGTEAGATKFDWSSGYIACGYVCVTGDKARKGGEIQITSLECHAIEFGLILE